ncbi:hypothetical protein BGM19_31420 [Streptomyces agglomeratus]|uniref:hypothetical protein n=1 Tax=Streptomyces agglomeratus TaxID=285458 RepID=UPI00086A26CF|nr:hypothetical protein [Streptomyces agglomeratus]OEJ61864.1 hypothetical protein BGM19_31420 [Streptomyces agglomeratus]
MPTMTGKRWKTRLLPAFLIAGFVVWMTMVCVSIANEPPEGSASAQSLRGDVAQAVQDQDADRLQNLFHPDTVADGYATALFERLKEAESSDVSPTLRTEDQQQVLVLKGTSADGAVCVPWQVTEEDSRWYLDGTPPLNAHFCNGR